MLCRNWGGRGTRVKEKERDKERGCVCVQNCLPVYASYASMGILYLNVLVLRTACRRILCIFSVYYCILNFLNKCSFN